MRCGCMKNLLVVTVLILCLGFSSAVDVSYKEKFVETRYFSGDSVVSRTTLVDYDNEDRHSAYDYRHGYSYRTTRDYFDRKVNANVEMIRSRDSWYNDRYDYDSGRKARYYVYVPYMRGYEERECYLSPPSDKLFYVEC